eukprot:CAMPEP_0194747594 /NCGR_PEP_ID=MMETSP0323_2-20130528/1740_1 /TAXON_ID=2866 ORGANISM="Crypthecodinium cohnii, Strain Seligo" /NCGR_SAMPLE_ID=MMETSP0323_2 /ASSEMBLY_ACC=CAM_ASM_000346 /LENGTH=121 /DNA_ID=CAMNT_0039661145 /DNA_START=18 /DNA_END=380 /DNA_ORIENTATION=-
MIPSLSFVTISCIRCPCWACMPLPDPSPTRLVNVCPLQTLQLLPKGTIRVESVAHLSADPAPNQCSVRRDPIRSGPPTSHSTNCTSTNRSNDRLARTHLSVGGVVVVDSDIDMLATVASET